MSTTNANQPQHGESKSQGGSQGSQSGQGSQGNQSHQGSQSNQGQQGEGSKQGMQRGGQQGGGSQQGGGQGGGSQQGMADMGNQVEELREDFAELVSNVSDAVQRYYAARPGVAAATLFGLGFFVGWKLKPW
jgi:hypothetical protein